MTQYSPRPVRPVSTALFIVLAMLATSGCSTAKTRPPRGVQLSGTWQLNESLSDGLSALSRSGVGPSGGGGGRGTRRSGGMGGGGGGGGGGGRMRGGGMGGGGGRMQGGGSDGATGAAADPGASDPGRRERGAGFRQPKVLLIDQGARQLKLVADGASDTFVYGAKTDTAFAAGKAATTSGWDSDHFVVTLKVENGPTITRSYSTVDDGHRLIVETNLSGGRGAGRKIVSVYEPAVRPPSP